MDRPLSLGDIELALGGAVGLPSPEELRRMMAQAEIGLLSQSLAAPDDLARAAWYLHAVGSARESLDLYGVERQRRALAISAHIFDLYLDTEELPAVDRLRYVFAAQVAFVRSEADPNAIAIRRRQLAAPQGLDFVDDSDTVALELGSAILGVDLETLYRELAGLERQRARLARDLDLDLAATIFAAQEGVLVGVRNLLQFLTRGVEENLERANEAFLAAANASSAEADITSRWVAAHLLQVGEQLRGSSIWTALPPEVPSAVRRAFSLASPRVLTLWPPQLGLLGANNERSPLRPHVRRALISIPTSSGKTLLSQLLVMTHLATTETGVCFVAPTRSLVREVRSSLRGRMRYLNSQVFADTLDAPDEGPPAGTVQVLTPEGLAFLVRTDPDGVLERFGLFVIDEAHLLGDGARGWNLEATLAFLHQRSAHTQHRIVLMSAALGNHAQVASWLDPDGDGAVFTSPWRGPRRLYGIYRTEPDWDDRTYVRAGHQTLRRYPLTGRIHVRTPVDEAEAELTIDEPVGELYLNAAGKRADPSTRFYRMLPPLVEALAHGGPVLVISPTKPDAMRLATAIAEHLGGPHLAVAWLVDLVQTRLGSEHPLTSCIRRGVAYHHGSLPDDVLTAIEDAVRDDQLDYVVATTTLTEGVNLPVRTVLISAQGSWSAEGFDEYITGSRLVNALGRAGRATKETEGWVILARQDRFSRHDFERLEPSAEEMTISSELLSSQTLTALQAFEDRLREGVDAVFAESYGSLGDFLAYIWFVVSAAADSGEETEQAALEATRATFAWNSASGTTRKRLEDAAVEVALRATTTDSVRRRRIASTGTSLASAAIIDSVADRLASSAHMVADRADPLQIVDLLADTGLLDSLLRLPEHVHKPPRPWRTAGVAHQFDVPAASVLRSWLMGAAIEDLANTYFGRIRDVAFRMEQLADFVTATFENYLPWAIGSALRIANQQLAQPLPPSEPLCPNLPAFIRYGVRSNLALELLRSGMTSRSTATAIADAYAGDAEEELDLRGWLARLDVPQWVRRFNPSPSDLTAMLEYARRPGSDALNRLLDGDELAYDFAAGLVETDTSVLLRHPEDDPLRIEVLAGDDRLAYAPAEYLAALTAAIAIGVPLSATLRPEQAKTVLSVQLNDEI